MRAGPTDEAIAGSVSWLPQVAAWFNGVVIADDVPVVSGRITADVTQDVPERLTLTVPRYSTVNGHRFDWRPNATNHPLARYGQCLSVQIITGSTATDTTWTTRVGMYRIQTWTVATDGLINIEAVGMLQVIADRSLPFPMAPAASSAFQTEMRRLLPPPFTLSIDPLVDTARLVPVTMAWEDDRLGALYEMAEAWPVRLRTSEDGWRIVILPTLTATPGPPVLTYTDGMRGTIVSAPISDSRDKAYNEVIARSSKTDDPDSAPLFAIVDQPFGPMSVTGPYGVVTKIWSTPLASTVEQLELSGRTLLNDNLRPATARQLEIAPDPRPDLDDSVQIVFDGETLSGWVVAYDMPLTVGDGPMRLTVGVV